jgi:hypothetical protein
MFSLTIRINGKTLYDVSDINIGKVEGSRLRTRRTYQPTCGHQVMQDRDLGPSNLTGILVQRLNTAACTLKTVKTLAIPPAKVQNSCP